MGSHTGLAESFSGARLTLRGVCFVVVAVLGFVVAYAAGWAALLAVSLFLGGAVLAAVASVVVAPPALEVERRIDPGVVEQRQEVRVRVSLRGAAGGTVDWAERVPPTVVVTGPVAGRLHLRDRVALLEYGVSGRRRGAVALGPFGVVRSDPLGLAVTRRVVGGADTLVVLPRMHAVRAPAIVTRTDPDSAASSAFGPVGDQRDIIARSYQAGDPMRSVDWRATARRGELMVRTEAAASASSTALALETRTDAWPDDRTFEAAVEYAASMAAALGERGSAVRFAGGRGTAVTEDAFGALVALALAERTDGAPRPAELAARLLGSDVRVVHVVTGSGSVADLHRLPRPPHGATGLVTVVGRPGRVDRMPELPPGWRAARLDPATPEADVWGDA